MSESVLSYFNKDNLNFTLQVLHRYKLIAESKIVQEWDFSFDIFSGGWGGGEHNAKEGGEGGGDARADGDV